MVWHNYDLGCAGTGLQPRLHHRHLAGQPGVQRREVRGRRGQLGALPDLRGRQAARPARRRDPRRDVGHVQGRVHHVDRSRAGRARRSSCSCSPSAATWPGRRSARRSRSPRSWSGRPPTSTPVEWAKAADGLLLDGVTQMQEGFLVPGRARRPRHAADRARRPGRVRQLAARRVRLARRAAGPAARAATCCARRRSPSGGGRGPRQRGAGRAEEDRLRRARRSDGRPLHLLPGQVRQPDRRRRARRDPGRVHRAVPAAQQGAGARRRCCCCG